MKSKRVNSKHSCLVLCNNVYKRSVNGYNYYECDFCGSRIAIRNKESSTGWIDNDWLNDIDNNIPVHDSRLLIRKVYLFIISIALSFILLGLTGLVNDLFFHGGCIGSGKRVVADSCMVKQKNGTWSPMTN